MGTADGTATVGAPPSPYGRYMQSRLRRWGFTVFLALLVAVPAWVVAAPAKGLTTTGLDVGTLIWVCVVVVAAELILWLVPLTVVDQRGIRRGPRRRIGWEEIAGFSVEEYGRSAWVFVHLHDERRLRLQGVPAAVVPGLWNAMESPPL